MEDTTQAFLARFIALEGELRHMVGGREEGFGRLLSRALDSSPVVRRYQAELRAFNDLRNMLVHAPLPMPLAHPAPEALATLERIHQELTHPQPVIPRFARQVAALSHDDPFSRAVEAMRETGYSQFPVYRGDTFAGLLTDGLMARWIATHLDRVDGSFRRLLDVRLGDVLHQVPERSTVAFVGRKATVAHVREMFEQHLRRGKLRLDAVLITETGDPDQAPVGIITPTDAVAMIAQDGAPPPR